MAQYGQIKNYDSGKGHGMITPEKGGNALKFGKSDLQQEGQEPTSGQRFSYDTKKVAGNDDVAINLRQQDQEQDHKQGAQNDKRDQASKQQG